MSRDLPAVGLPGRSRHPRTDGILELTGRGTLAVFGLFAVVHVSLTVFSIGGYRSTPFAFGALALVLAAGFLVSAGKQGRLGRGSTVTVVVLCAVASTSVWNLPTAGWPGWASWIWGAVTFVVFMLALRGRTLAAWIAFTLMTAVTIAWCVLIGRGPLAGVGFVVRSAALLFVVSLFSLLLERTRRTIVRVQRAALDRAQSEASASAALDEQNNRLAQVHAQAMPALNRILSDEELTDDDRRYFALVEGALRDQLRAGGLARAEVVDAVRRARARGVNVSLLDDRSADDLVNDDWSLVEEAVVQQLDAASQGEVVARLLPEGRDALATIVATDGDDTVRLAVPTRDMATDVGTSTH